MISHVLRTIRRQKLLVGSNAQRLLCAVSGGPDSMALLACLWELAPRLGLYLEVATVDHGLRPEAAAEAALVSRRAAELNLPWHGLRVDVAAARARRVSSAAASAPAAAPGGVQEVARRLRLEALAALADRRQLGQVALGHNADDQTETVLFRIVRGTGLRGLAGIPYRRGPFIRPLLDVTRGQILRYLERRSLPYVTDPSNADPRYSRARLRHQLLPLLRQENPRVDRALRVLAASAAAEFNTLAGCAEEPRDGIHIPGSQAAAIADAVREGWGTQLFDIPGPRRVTVTYGRLSVGHATAAPPDPPSPIQLDGPGIHQFGADVRLAVRMQDPAEHPAEDPVQDGAADRVKWCWFDSDRIGWPLSARTRRPGDRMSPRGGKGSRKLSDLLIDAKIPRLERAGLPVVTSAAGELLFVPGLRPSQTGCPSSATLRRIGLAVLPKPDHDGLVDRSIAKGNTGRYPYEKRLPAEPPWDKSGGQ